MKKCILLFIILVLFTFTPSNATLYYENGTSSDPLTWHLTQNNPSLPSCQNYTTIILGNSTISFVFKKLQPENVNGILINGQINFSAFFYGSYGLYFSFRLYKEKDTTSTEICRTTEIQIQSSGFVNIANSCSVTSHWVEANYTLKEIIDVRNPFGNPRNITHYFGNVSCLSRVEVPELQLGFLRVNLSYPITSQNWINSSINNITCNATCDGGSCIFPSIYAVYTPNNLNWYIIGSSDDPLKNIVLGPGEANPKSLPSLIFPSVTLINNFTLLANNPSINNLIACNGTSIYSNSPTSYSSKVSINILLPQLDNEPPVIYPDAKATPTISNSAIKLNQTIKDNVNVSSVYFTIDNVNYSTSRNGDEFYRIGNCVESKKYHWTDTWANDTSGNMNHSTTGVSFICDVNAPLINLISPQNSTTITSQNLNFTFITMDDMFTSLNCGIFLDGSLNQTNTSVFNNTLTNFTINGIGIGNHTWQIKCKDAALNLGESEIRTFSIIIAPASCGNGICESSETTINCPQDCCNLSIVETYQECCNYFGYTWISGYGCCGNAANEGVCGSYCYDRNTKKCCTDGYYLCSLLECCSNYACYSQGACKEQLLCKLGSWEFNCTACPCSSDKICVNNMCIEKKCSEYYCCTDADCFETCNNSYLVQRYCPSIGSVCAERSRTNCEYGCLNKTCYTTKQNLNVIAQTDKERYEKNEIMRIIGEVYYPNNQTKNFNVNIIFKIGDWNLSKRINTSEDGRFKYDYWISFADPEGNWTIIIEASDEFGNYGNTSITKEIILSSTSIYNVNFLEPAIDANVKRGEIINISINVTENSLPVTNANAIATITSAGGEKIELQLIESENGIYKGSYKINYNETLGLWIISAQALKTIDTKNFGGGNFTRIIVLPANIIIQLISPEKTTFSHGEKIKIAVKAIYENGEIVEDTNISVFSPQGKITLSRESEDVYSTNYTINEIGNFTLNFNALDGYENQGTKIVVFTAKQTLKGFLENYFYFFIIASLLIAIFYKSVLIRLPFYKEKRISLDIKKFESEIEKLRNLKIKTEAQYYKGEIDEKSFENMMRKYQEDIVERENKIRILNETLEKIKAEKLKK